MPKAQPWVMGISSSHNGAVCLMQGNRLAVAIQEERLARRKRYRITAGASSLAVNYCLGHAGIRAQDLDLVVVTAQGRAGAPENDAGLNPQLQLMLHRVPVLYISNHLAHAYSAFGGSGFREAAVLVADGMGSPRQDLLPEEQRAVTAEFRNGWEAISLYEARGAEMKPLRKHLVEDGAWLITDQPGMPRFRTLGGMYAAAAVQIFGDDTEAGKVMGLAPYGRPSIPPEEFFEMAGQEFVYLDRVPARYTGAERWPHCESEYIDLASSTQAALETALLGLTAELHQAAPAGRLCYAGGVALNSVANERIVREGPFDEVFIHPAAEDSGTAVGAAYYGLWKLTGSNCGIALRQDRCGVRYPASQIRAAVTKTPGVETLDVEDVLDTAADMLCDGKILGWFQEGSELGPRALGQRSILCDPRNPEAKALLNGKVKHREAFRPFAPAILLEEVERWFDAGGHPSSPFMLRVCPFRPEMAAQVPAVAHVDGTGRLQTVTAQENGRFHQIIARFFERTGVPMLVNTSFNVMGEPIVETPEDALWCLLYTGLDACVLEDVIAVKKPGYRSSLDLYPRITASRCSFSMRPGEPFDGLARSGGMMHFRADTRWGSTEQRLPLSLLPVLSAIDGRSNGWEILERSAQSATPFQERELTASLGRLRRASVVAFSEEPLL
jgi:carbamoyltransferase